MSAAPSEAAPGEKQAARLPGLRGHHKLYLAAVALVAVCVWLIVWLVVFGKVLPTTLGRAVVFQVTVKTGISLLARHVAGAGTVVAPADPEGRSAQRRASAPRPRGRRAGPAAGAGRRRRGAARPADPDAAGLFASLLLAVPLACVCGSEACGWFPNGK